MTADRPTYYNRIVPIYYFDRESQDIYALGKRAEREAVLIFRKYFFDKIFLESLLNICYNSIIEKE